MINQILAAAENAEHAEAAIDPAIYGVGTFVVLMALLGVTMAFKSLRFRQDGAASAQHGE